MLQEITDKKIWEAFVRPHAYGHFLQSWQWGQFQKTLGKPVKYYGYWQDKKLLGVALVVWEKIKGAGEFAQCPRGPVLDPHLLASVQTAFATELVNAVYEERPSIFLRIEPEWEESVASDEHSIAGKKQDATGALFSIFQKPPLTLTKGGNPAHTRLLDLTKPATVLLSEMKPKTRYNIRLTERKKVRVVQGSDKVFQANFLKLLTETTERDAFRSHPAIYYQKQLDFFGPSGELAIFQAMVADKPAAAIVVSFYGKRATYLHGASGYEFRAAMPAFAAQWAAIQVAQARDCTTYDFWGIAPPDANAHHPWAGITRFKAGFGGYPKTWAGPLDYVYRRFMYRCYTGYKKFRA